MEHAFLSQKGGGGGRGFKEKDASVSNIEAVKEKDLKEEPVAMEDLSPLVDQTNPMKTGGDHTHHYLHRELIRLETPQWNPDVDLLKEDVGNVPVWVKLHGVPVTAFSEDGLSAIATKVGTLLMLDSYTSDTCLQSWGRLSYARVMIEIRADMELKDTIMVAMPKFVGGVGGEGGYYTCTVYVEYEWKPPKCSCCKVFGHTQEECPKNIGLGVAKNLKKPSQTSRVDNDVEFGTNEGTIKLVNNEANSSGPSFMNVENSSTTNTPIIDKIGK
ncbi:hypothetical protein Tco_0360967 [Tanacetum coccineum]